MASRNALMEWLEQTKKISKMVDYICMKAIDSIINIQWLLDPKMIQRNQDFFDPFCKYYHKPNPMDYLYQRKKKLKCFHCPHGETLLQTLSAFVESSISRCRHGIQDIQWQWFEIIDFMYERPELVNPALIDEYIEQKIGEVCRNKKKNNPLKNGMQKRFGKFWKDKKGQWRKERRQRF